MDGFANINFEDEFLAAVQIEPSGSGFLQAISATVHLGYFETNLKKKISIKNVGFSAAEGFLGKTLPYLKI